MTPEREVGHGEFQVKPRRFSGYDRADAKRKALNFWYQNRDQLKLTLRDFFLRCRLSADERTITFY